ncbi:MAG: ECF-type sigma factor [Planctomycetota bacterium]
MSERDDEITLWMKQMVQQPDRSAERIWAHYYDRLVQYASRQLGDAPRRVLDGEDLATSALHAMHRGAVKGRFPQFENRDDLWRILLTIASRKAKATVRRETAQKRGGGATRGESIFGTPGDGSPAGLADFCGREPTPEFAEVVSVETDELLDQLGDATLKRVAIFKLQGFTNAEIADELDCAVRSVDRKLARIRQLWQ